MSWNFSISKTSRAHHDLEHEAGDAKGSLLIMNFFGDNLEEGELDPV